MILRNALLFILTFGASLTLGLLSFSGMFVIWPIIPLAIAAFLLAIAYEGEIFWQNIKGAFKTLFSRQALRRQLFREFLHDHMPDGIDIKDLPEDLPVLLKDYLKDIQALQDLEHHAEHQKLNAENKAFRKRLKQKISAFEIEFAKHLLDLKSSEDNLSEDVKKCRQWFRENKGEAFKKTHYLRLGLFAVSKVFSVIAGACICFGTGYLLFDAFMTVPFLAAIPAAGLPIIIISLAIISGIAYTLIVYNTITAMLNNRTLQNFYETLKKDFKEGWSFRNVVKGIGAFIFVGLTITLTVFTAGTWWTIGQNLAFIVHEAWLITCTAFIAASTLFINFFNSICTWFGVKERIEASLEEIAAQEKEKPTVFTQIKGLFKQAWASYTDAWKKPIHEEDHPLQKYNPFRILIKILLIPIDWLLFLAHIISIGVGGDQFPGVPQAASAAVGAAADFIEDYERVIGHNHKHPHTLKAILKSRSESSGGHEHTLDLPRKCIKLLLTPLYIFAILFDFFVMLYHAPKAELTWSKGWELFKAACIRQYTNQDPRAERADKYSYYDASKQDENARSFASKKFHAKLLVQDLGERLDTSLVRGKTAAHDKVARLKIIETEIEATTDDATLQHVLNTASQDKCIKTQRYCFLAPPEDRKTHTEKGLSNIYDAVCLVPNVMG
jgi:hypothetical protein